MYHFRQSSPVTSPSLRRFTSRLALNNPGASRNWILRSAVRSGTAIIKHKSPPKLYQKVLIKIRNTKGTITDLRLLCIQARTGLKSTQSLATEKNSFGLMVVDLFLWRYLKGKISANKPAIIPHLKQLKSQYSSGN